MFSMLVTSLVSHSPSPSGLQLPMVGVHRLLMSLIRLMSQHDTGPQYPSAAAWSVQYISRRLWSSALLLGGVSSLGGGLPLHAVEGPSLADT